MKLSIIIPFHTSRIDLLAQTLRFLESRETVADYQLVLICQDRFNLPLGRRFKKATAINLDSGNYNRPKMCNRGVELAESENIAILDSDRILPKNYFGRMLPKLEPGKIISTHRMFSLAKTYDDEAIISGKIEKHADHKSQTNEMLTKNGFSGNTLMKKSDYLKMGGMDESFVGYGFSDNDAMKTAEKAGLVFEYVPDEELHLHHKREIYLKHDRLGHQEVMRICALNGLKYCVKWGLEPTVQLKELVRDSKAVSML